MILRFGNKRGELIWITVLRKRCRFLSKLRNKLVQVNVNGIVVHPNFVFLEWLESRRTANRATFDVEYGAVAVTTQLVFVPLRLFHHDRPVAADTRETRDGAVFKLFVTFGTTFKIVLLWRRASCARTHPSRASPVRIHRWTRRSGSLLFWANYSVFAVLEASRRNKISSILKILQFIFEAEINE